MVRRESPCSIATGTLILCAATPAETVYLKDMGHHLPNDLIVDLFFKAFHQADMQINDLAAGKADEMVVMIAVRTEIVVELPVRMDDLADYPSSRKFIQIAVNSRKAYTGELLLQLLADLFGADVGAGLG